MGAKIQISLHYWILTVLHTCNIVPFDSITNVKKKTGLKFCMKENIWLSQDFFAIEDTWYALMNSVQSTELILVVEPHSNQLMFCSTNYKSLVMKCVTWEKKSKKTTWSPNKPFCCYRGLTLFLMLCCTIFSQVN